MDPLRAESFEPLGGWLELLVHRAGNILDAGCGPTGAEWWEYKPAFSRMTAVDLHYQPQILPPNTDFVRSEIGQYCQNGCEAAAFDLIIADHILEHVFNPGQVACGFNRALATGGWIHVGVPDASNFTDRFYRLIHPEGGGHVSLFTRDTLLVMMEQAGFALVAIRPWGDDWGWLRHLYDPAANGVKFTSKDDIQYVADVFQKELTVEKGYYYGWEAVFQKKCEVTLPAFENVFKSHLLGIDASFRDSPKTDQAPSWSVEPLNTDEIIELRWITQKTRRLKKTRLYRLIKKVFQSKINYPER
jgi:hypothetical protein